MGYGGGGRAGRLLYLSLHCHHQNDSCIKMGSDHENHFNVHLIARDKVTRQCPQTTIMEVKGEPKQIRTEVPLLQYQPTALSLGQTGSRRDSTFGAVYVPHRVVARMPSDSYLGRPSSLLSCSCDVFRALGGSDDSSKTKLQALVCSILPPTTALGPRNLNCQLTDSFLLVLR